MTKTILIIEDDEFLQGLEAKKLTKEGYATLVAGNSDVAFKQIEDSANKIDLILLDLLLPGTSGIDILKKIKENQKVSSTPIIVFSNLAEESYIKETKKIGVNEFMVKSNFTLDELVLKIKSIIG